MTDLTANDGPGVAGLVSVIIPTYKRAALVARAVDSALAQDYECIEVLVIDDGSPDDTASRIAARYAQELRVRYLRKPNGGLSSARNHGLRHARGEFVALLDDDDVWQPWKVASQVACLRALADSGVGMIWTDFDQVSDAGAPVKTRAMRSSLSAYTLMDGNRDFQHAGKLGELMSGCRAELRSCDVYWGEMFSQIVLGNLCLPSTMMLTRERVALTGFYDETLAVAEDHQFNLKCCRIGPVALLDAAAVGYRVGSQDQMTHRGQQLPYAENFLQLILPILAHERHRLTLSDRQIKALLASAHGWYGYELFERGSRALARRHLGLSLRQQPANRRNWQLWASTLVPAAVSRRLRTMYRRAKGGA